MSTHRKMPNVILSLQSHRGNGGFGVTVVAACTACGVGRKGLSGSEDAGMGMVSACGAKEGQGVGAEPLCWTPRGR